MKLLTHEELENIKFANHSAESVSYVTAKKLFTHIDAQRELLEEAKIVVEGFWKEQCGLIRSQDEWIALTEKSSEVLDKLTAALEKEEA